jgi:[ribosomal protein S5]-alanine N-acetyltransferase
MMLVVPQDFTITTARCLLRYPSVADIEHIFAATRFVGFNDGMLWEPPASLADLEQPLQNNFKGWAAGLNFTFTITDRATQDFLGRVSIRRMAATDIMWNIGFFTHPQYQGQGYMTEAVQAIVRFGFETLDADRIEAAHATWNIGSQKVLEKAGLKFVKSRLQGFQKKGQWVADNIMSITQADWKNSEQ